MIQATGDIGTKWLLDLCNGIVKEGSIPEDWKSSVVLPIYKGKGDPAECGSYTGIKLLGHAVKVVERIFEHRIRQQLGESGTSNAHGVRVWIEPWSPIYKISYDLS